MDRVYVYPHYYIKDGVKELAHIVGIVVDETDVAISYFAMYDLNNPKEPNNAPLKVCTDRHILFYTFHGLFPICIFIF